MQPRSPFGKLTSAVLFAAVCAYLVAHIHATLENSGTVTLTYTHLSECKDFEGVALRSEILVSEQETAQLPENGQRVPADSGQSGSTTSHASALYFENIDGYEYLTADESSFSAAELDTLLSCGKSAEKGHGRLVTGRFWYCAAYLYGEAPEGKCTVSFEGIDESIEGELIRSCKADNGKTAVLMKFPLGKNEFLSLRFCRGKIHNNEYTGLMVPANALITDSEGNYSVNTLTAVGEKTCPAEIIYEGKDFFLIKPTDEIYAGVRVESGE